MVIVESGNLVQAAFAAILPNTQQQVVVLAQLPIGSGATPGTLVRNQGFVRYDNSMRREPSNMVANTVVAPALVLEKQVAQIEVKAGDLADYTLRVRNVGSGRAENLTLTDSPAREHGCGSQVRSCSTVRFLRNRSTMPGRCRRWRAVVSIRWSSRRGSTALKLA